MIIVVTKGSATSGRSDSSDDPPARSLARQHVGPLAGGVQVAREAVAASAAFAACVRMASASNLSD